MQLFDVHLFCRENLLNNLRPVSMALYCLTKMNLVSIFVGFVFWGEVAYVWAWRSFFDRTCGKRIEFLWWPSPVGVLLWSLGAEVALLVWVGLLRTDSFPSVAEYSQPPIFSVSPLFVVVVFVPILTRADWFSLMRYSFRNFLTPNPPIIPEHNSPTQKNQKPNLSLSGNRPPARLSLSFPSLFRFCPWSLQRTVCVTVNCAPFPFLWQRTHSIYPFRYPPHKKSGLGFLYLFVCSLGGEFYSIIEKLEVEELFLIVLCLKRQYLWKWHNKVSKGPRCLGELDLSVHLLGVSWGKTINSKYNIGMMLDRIESGRIVLGVSVC